jgi:uncharacterized protein YbjT (DUF2867 family)
MSLSLPRLPRLLVVFLLYQTAAAWSPQTPRHRHGHVLGATPSARRAAAGTGPVVVVGATGKVGRLVVEQLLAQGMAVRAVVRNATKATQVFAALPHTNGTTTNTKNPLLELVTADLCRHEESATVLDEAVAGATAIISVMGVVRVSKWTDWWPWRIFSSQADWADRSHPYYGNYLGQTYLIGLAEKHKVGRFVRLTGLGLAYSPFHPFAILFNTLLSFNNRWGLLTEQALYASKIPTVVLRPGGLAADARNASTTNLQVDVSGKLPFPGRVGRADVAALAVASITELADVDGIPSKFVLACRWCGEGVQPRPQGVKEDGYATAVECLQAVAREGVTSPPPPARKPYGLAVALTVYSLMAVASKLAWWLWRVIARALLG